MDHQPCLRKSLENFLMRLLPVLRSNSGSHKSLISSSTSSVGSFFCPACKCGQLQIREDVFCCRLCPNRQEIDFFALLGLPRVYSVKIEEAEDHFRNLQKTAHPDRLDEETAKKLPEGFSSLLNKAIRVIRSPTERAMHLLYLLDGCSIPEGEITSDSALLLEMMEANEEVEDCGKNKECLERQSQEIKERLSVCDSQLRTLFTQREYKAVRKVCEKMHYLERINDTLIRKLNSL